MKKQINITIAGQTAIGKSTVMWSLIKTLQENGIEVEMEDSDHGTIERLKNHMEHDITMEQRFMAIKEKVKVKVKEINTYS